MDFSGTAVIDGATVDDTWLILADPVAIAEVTPGCEFIAPAADVDDVDSYAPPDVPTFPDASAEEVRARAFEEGGEYVGVMEVGVGSVKPRFVSDVTITTRQKPEMAADLAGSGGDSAFEMETWMTMSETADGVEVEWEASVDISGRLAQMGGNVLEPVADRLVNRFFDQMEDRMQGIEA